MKTISILLALINSLAAGLVIAASLPAIHILRPAASLWSMTKVMAGVSIIFVGILTWILASHAGHEGLILLTGLFLVALGAASTVWTVHLALIGGSIKDYMFLYGGSLATQGATSVWTLVSSEKTAQNT